MDKVKTVVYRQTYQRRLAQQHQAREKRRREALTAVTAALSPIAAAFPSIKRVYLFGSIIRPGQFHEQSDIDVGVVGATAVDYFGFWRELEYKLPDWLIDLRDVGDASHFANRAKQSGNQLYERTNPSASS